MENTLKKTIKANPEFASELVCVVPHTYWLHQQGLLEKVITSKEMKPFYYFCDNVEEFYDIQEMTGETPDWRAVEYAPWEE